MIDKKQKKKIDKKDKKDRKDKKDKLDEKKKNREIFPRSSIIKFPLISK